MRKAQARDQELKNYLDTLPHKEYNTDLPYEVNAAQEMMYWVTALAAEFDLADYEARKIVYEWLNERH